MENDGEDAVLGRSLIPGRGEKPLLSLSSPPFFKIYSAEQRLYVCTTKLKSDGNIRRKQIENGIICTLYQQYCAAVYINT